MKVSDKLWRTMLALAVMSVLVCGCGDDDDSELYALSTAVGDPVPVTISGTLGTLVLTLTDNPIPNDPSATLLGLLTQGTIGLNVTNDVTGVNYNLIEGANVAGAPAAAGQYSVADNNGDGTLITITFFNEFNDAMIHGAGDYTATVTVIDNPFFLTEQFLRNVTVTEL